MTEDAADMFRNLMEQVDPERSNSAFKVLKGSAAEQMALNEGYIKGQAVEFIHVFVVQFPQGTEMIGTIAGGDQTINLVVEGVGGPSQSLLKIQNLEKTLPEGCTGRWQKYQLVEDHAPVQ